MGEHQMLFLGAAGVLAAQVALFWFFYKPAQRAELWQLLVRRWRPPPPPPPEPPPAPPPPPAPLQELAPLFGNIPLIPSETEPELGETDEFPAPMPPATRYEDLNWRLILFDETDAADAPWPIRPFNDYPMLFRGSARQLNHHVRTRLRPRYPVIVDWDGDWYQASTQLERTPTLQLPLLDAYLGLAPEQRPVIISRIPKPNVQRANILHCLRYGFADYRFPLDAIPPYPRDALACLLDCLTGPHEEWLWFSVARMRATVIAANEAAEALLTQLQEEAEQHAAIQHENRFAALWKLREAPEPTEAPAPPEPAPEPAS